VAPGHAWPDSSVLRKGTIMDKTATHAATDAAAGAGLVGRNRARKRTRMRRSAAAFAMASVLAGGVVLAVAGPSHAETAQGPGQFVEFQNVATQQCLQDNGSNGGKPDLVVTQPCTGNSDQSWVITYGQLTAVNRATGLCLQSNSRIGKHHNLHTLPCTGAADQNWILKVRMGNEFVAENQQTHLCVENDQHGNVYMHKCNSTHRQVWLAIVEGNSSPSAGPPSIGPSAGG
jgi:hypothetical protein